MARVTMALGRYGEEVAAGHLEAAGMRLIQRNWRCNLGEIDILALDGDVLVVCEVKTRRGVGFGRPVEAVTAAKLARLRRLAVRWLTTTSQAELAEGEEPILRRVSNVRIDVIGVLVPAGAPVQIDHLRGVG